MEIMLGKRLFWFLKDGVKLDLSQAAHVDMYVQQVISYGRTEDIKELLKNIDISKFKSSLARIKNFLPAEVRKFWEDFVAVN